MAVKKINKSIRIHSLTIPLITQIPHPPKSNHRLQNEHTQLHPHIKLTNSKTIKDHSHRQTGPRWNRSDKKKPIKSNFPRHVFRTQRADYTKTYIPTENPNAFRATGTKWPPFVHIKGRALSTRRPYLNSDGVRAYVYIWTHVGWWKWIGLMLVWSADVSVVVDLS